MASLTEYQALVALAEAESVRGASERSGLPRSTVSRAVRRLEERVGVPLVLAEGRAMHLTPEGRQLAADARRVLADLADSEAAARGSRPSRPLVVSAPPPGGNLLLTDLLTEFLTRNPSMPVHLEATNRFVDLAAEGVDLAIRAGRRAEPDQVVVPLLKVCFGLAASVRYLDEHCVPRTPEDLGGHALLLPAFAAPPAPWPLPGERPREVRVALTTADHGLLRHAARSGVGIALLNYVVGASEDELVRVLPDLQGPTVQICLVFAASRRSDPRVRAFVDGALAYVADRMRV